MIIYGEKVVLRAIEENDNEMLKAIINDPDTENMLGGKSFPVSTIAQKKWYDNLENSDRIMRCVIAEKSEPQIGFGTIILSDIDYINGTAQIHIKLSNSSVRNRGFGTDAVKALTDYAFGSLRLNCLYAEIISYNKTSQKLFTKCGYNKDGILKSRIYKKGSYWDVFVFSKQR